MKKMKVYVVTTGICEPGVGGDVQNFQCYKILAKDAEEAISKVKKSFKLQKREYIQSVEMMTSLDE